MLGDGNKIVKWWWWWWWRRSSCGRDKAMLIVAFKEWWCYWLNYGGGDVVILEWRCGCSSDEVIRL